MTKTTIELPESTRDKLKAERKPHESNYGETIERLLGEPSAEFVTRAELEREIERKIEEYSR